MSDDPSTSKKNAFKAYSFKKNVFKVFYFKKNGSKDNNDKSVKKDKVGKYDVLINKSSLFKIGTKIF